jgi:hypothetical protein
MGNAKVFSWTPEGDPDCPIVIDPPEAGGNEILLPGQNVTLDGERMSTADYE